MPPAPHRILLSLGTALAIAMPPSPAAATEPTLASEWRRPGRPSAEAPVNAAPAPKPAAASRPAVARRTPTPDGPPALEPPSGEAPPSTSPTPADPRAEGLAPIAAAPPAATPPADAPAEAAAPPAATPPVPDDARPVPQDIPTPDDAATACRASRPTRNAVGELVAGAAITGAGLLSFGVAARGLQLTRVSARELARSDGYPPELVAPLYTQRDRGETMLAAGAIAGVLGVALGVALLATGARDLKVARRERPLAHLRVAPTLGGLTLAGRF